MVKVQFAELRGAKACGISPWG